MMPIIQAAATLALAAVVAWIINARVPMPASIKSIVNIVLWLIVIGIGLWLINAYIPMAGVIKAILNIVVVIATCVWVLRAFGLWNRVVQLLRNFPGAVR
jgi:hypothetical protein